MAKSDSKPSNLIYDSVVAIFQHVLKSLFVTLAIAIACLAGIAGSPNFDDLSNWRLWLVVVTGLLTLLFALNSLRLLSAWWRLRRIRRVSGSSIAVMLASFEGDDERNSIRASVRECIKAELGNRVELIVWPEVLRVEEGNDDDAEAAAIKKARKWLKSKNCDLLLWGRVKKDNVVGLRITARELFDRNSNTYVLSADEMTLPTSFISDLGVAIALRIVTAPRATENDSLYSAIDDNLAKKLEKLISNPPAQFSEEVRSVLLHEFGNAEASIGRRSGDIQKFQSAIDSYKKGLRKLGKNADARLKGALLDDLGSAQADMGIRSADPTILKNAMKNFREAIRCFDSVKSDVEKAWASNHLGSALRHLGEREADPAILREAAEEFKKARRTLNRKQHPQAWVLIQNNYGNVLTVIGERTNEPERFVEAINAHEEVLKEISRIDQPITWGVAQNNLGMDLFALGSRSEDITILNRAISAFSEGLNACSQNVAPAMWETIQHNLTLAYTELGRIQEDPKLFLKAIAILHSLLALSDNRLTLGMYYHSLGNAQFGMGEVTQEIGILNDALVSYRKAVQFLPRRQVPFRWAGAMDNIGGVICLISDISGEKKDIPEAVDSCRAALQIFEAAGASFDAQTAKARLDHALRLATEGSG